jgi:hypothetical protein
LNVTNAIVLATALMTTPANATDVTPAAFLEITLKVEAKNRPAAAAVYTKYKAPFLAQVKGAKSKQLLLRDDDVQVLHGFDTAEHANAYLKSPLFNDDVVKALAPLLAAPPEVRIYTAN